MLVLLWLVVDSVDGDDGDCDVAAYASILKFGHVEVGSGIICVFIVLVVVCIALVGVGVDGDVDGGWRVGVGNMSYDVVVYSNECVCGVLGVDVCGVDVACVIDSVGGVGDGVVVMTDVYGVAYVVCSVGVVIGVVC